MARTQFYKGTGVDPAFCLRYSWTGWPTGSTFDELPDVSLLKTIDPSWETDGLRLLENCWSPARIQLTFTTKPNVSPVFLATRAKGRLQDALRKAGHPQRFSRKLSVRSVGENTTKQVQEYIRSQVGKESFVDASFAEKMKEFTVVNPEVDLAMPNESARGRYWYNLHLVLVVLETSRIADLNRLAAIRDGCFRIADQKGYGIGSLSVMLDHLHVAMRGDHAQSPEEIALVFQNDLASLARVGAIWRETYYVGTFTEYDMWAIRNRSLQMQNAHAT